MSGTGTRTKSTTETFAEQVLRVTRPILTDLLEIVDNYPHLTKDEALNYVLDFREFMNERYLKHVEVTWTDRTTGVVIDGLKYIIVNGEAVRAMERPGGIRYDKSIAAARFNLRIYYTDLWRARTPEQQTKFKTGLRISWGTANALNYGRGAYVTEDRQYGATSVGVSRLRFKSS